MHQPVLVEDVSLTLTAMGRLPGTLIKWFLEELGNDGLCKLADGLDSRAAVAEIMYGLHDGADTHFFYAANNGQIAKTPRGSLGFGWNSIFIPDGYQKTLAEMTDKELRGIGLRSHALTKLRKFLEQN
ncbi:MAG TPA: non-canonical purine NTP pyrophosphatase, partial [Patescibacteria group bacterium]|nr:non-canonical purine NTP pyrophosphatase [Patescibacteria group bacterium]